jgi:hypothetical protein
LATVGIETPLVPPTAAAVNSIGSNIEIFVEKDTVYVSGTGFPAAASVDVYVVDDVETWNDDDPIPTDVSDDDYNTIVCDGSGVLPITAIWNPPLSIGEYDIVFDVNQNGYYDLGIDGIDSGSPGFIVVNPATPVGGESYIVSKMLLLAPWLALTLVIGAGAFILIRRRVYN